ncbi:MAG: menaquinone biosynthesis protein, partial [Nitrospirae bacterium]|nr:menaquinone biosynthesis protein [Nitrospirota bacterium]
MALRVGEINYSNCIPIFYTLKKRHYIEGYTFIQGIPSELNQLISDGRIDISPSSSIEYAINPEKYLILPDLSISSVKRVESILLFSQFRIEDLNNKTIGLTKASATSTVLLKILLKRLYGYSNTFIDTEESLEDGLKKYPAYLLIGDEALNENINKKGLFVYDLGKLWYNLTGKPFVFALWLVRKESASFQKGLIAQFYKDLLASKKEAYNNFVNIADDIKAYNNIRSERLIRYWKTIS